MNDLHLIQTDKQKIAYKKYYDANKIKINERRKLIKYAFKSISTRLEKKLKKIWMIKKKTDFF